jgi:hypothetical protein
MDLNDAPGDPPPRCSELPRHSRAWKVDIQARVIQLDVELDQLAQRKTSSPTLSPNDRQDDIVLAARRELDEACKVLSKKNTIRSLFRNNNVEIAYIHVHAAEVYRDRLLTQPELQARAPYLAAKAKSLLPPHSQRRDLIEALADPTGRVELYPPGAYELAFAQARHNLYEIGDQRYSQLRRFRNNLIAAGLLLSVVVVLLVVIGRVAPDALPLCFRPQGATEPGDVVTACPTQEERLAEADTSRDATILGDDSTDSQGPRDDDVLVVVLLGIVGGALSGALAAKSFRPPPNTPYNLPLYSFLFKLPVGALTAVSGLILISGEVIPGLSALDTQGQVLAYALLLGFAQQLFTQYLDKHAIKLLLGVPVKSEPEAGEAQPGADGS